MKTLVTFLLLTVAASAQDDRAPAIGGYTPPLPSPGSPAPPISEERLATLIDAAVTRAMARQSATSAPLASAQSPSAPAMASPQAAYAQPAQAFTSYLAAAPAPAQAAQINVLVPPGPMHQAMARLGNHLAAKGHPKVKTMTIAPQASIPTYTLTPAPTIVATAAPTQYTPVVPAPAQFVQPTPSAPVKASAQR